jgi:hypothetical protein
MLAGRLALALLAFACVAGCKPPRLGYRLHAGGVVMDGDTMRAVVAVEARSEYVDDRVLVVSCPRAADGSIDSARCRWQPLGEPVGLVASPARPPRTARRTTPEPQGPVEPARIGFRAGIAVRMASAAHGCPLDRVAVVDDAFDGDVEGYWIDVCGSRRLMRWDEGQGRFVERTPAE